MMLHHSTDTCSGVLGHFDLYTVQPHNNALHYNADFNITRACHWSQIGNFAICLV